MCNWKKIKEIKIIKARTYENDALEKLKKEYKKPTY